MQGDLARRFSLDGRHAVVTGAGSGIGRQTALTLAGAGAGVVLADVSEEGLEETAGLVGQAGGRAQVVRTDVTRRAEIEALADAAVERFGTVDAWVNCAGTILVRPLLETSEEDWDKVVSVNLRGVYWGCIAAGRVMREGGGGAIVNISSSGGETAIPGLSLYSMTKAGVNMVTRTVAKEFGPYNIRANAIAPGWVDTPMGLHSFRDETGKVPPERREEALKLRGEISPMGLTGTPEDIALAVLYLASDASRFMTGQILRPNGGAQMP